MTTAFPTGLDTFPSAATLAAHDLSTDPHSTLHGNLGDALAAVEAKVGIDSSGVTTTLDNRVATLETTATSLGTRVTTLEAALHPKGYIEGILVSWTDGTHLATSPGRCLDSAGTTYIDFTASDATNTATKDAINGVVRKTLTGTVATTTASGAVTGTSTAFLTELRLRTITGTVTSSGTAVTGTGTKFLTEVALNDMIGASNKGYSRVTAIASDTSLTLVAAPASAFNGNAANVIENPTIKCGTQTVKQVNTIVSDTSLTTASNGDAIASGLTAVVGDIHPTVSLYYYPYICTGLDAFSVRSTGTILSTQRTTPWLPTGVADNYRRLGSVVTDTSGNLLAFTSRRYGSRVKTLYQTALNTYSSRLVNAGSATSWTLLNCNTLAPPTSDAVWLVLLVNADAGAQRNVYVRPHSQGETAVSRNQSARAGASQISSNECYCECDGEQNIDYAVSNSAASVTIDLYGYEELV